MTVFRPNPCPVAGTGRGFFFVKMCRKLVAINPVTPKRMLQVTKTLKSFRVDVETLPAEVRNKIEEAQALDTRLEEGDYEEADEVKLEADRDAKDQMAVQMLRRHLRDKKKADDAAAAEKQAQQEQVETKKRKRNGLFW